MKQSKNLIYNVLMDLVAIQSENSRARGIGRYSEELSQNILKILKDDASIILNDLYPQNKKEIVDAYKAFILEENIKEYTILDISNKSFDQKFNYNRLNTFLLTKQFTQDSSIDIVHLHSIFEGLDGKADTLYSTNSMNNLKTAITLYDLIPLIFKDIYLVDKNVKKWYFNKLHLIYEADLLLAISDATKEDAINILGIPQNKVVNISGAIDNEKFYKMDKIEIEKNSSILNKYSITQPFIMYTGGIDFRKNIEASIKAYTKIEKQLFEKYQYVIVCKITKEQQEEFNIIIKDLKIPKNKVIFTNFVTDQELNFLYNKSDLFIFPSIYEGFGLPVLEAMTCGTAVIGSNVSSVPEIIGREDCMFNPSNIDEISQTINNILNNQNLKTQLENYFYNRAKEFSWNKSANTTIEAYQEILNEDSKIIKKLKVAFFTPLPNKRSGISDYSLELLPFLSKYMDIDIYIDDDYQVDDDYLNYNFNIYSYKVFESKKDEYETLIYQFGNSEFHKYMYDIALKNSGIIVLHDFFLSGLVNYIAHTTNNPEFFFDNLKYSHGNKGQQYINDIKSYKLDVAQTIKDLPINKKIIDSAKAIIVHSDYTKTLFKKYYEDDYNIHKINQLIKTPSRKTINNKKKYKEILNLNNDDIIISAFGHISESKQYDFILEALCKANLFKNNNIKLVFVGNFVSDIYKTKIENIIKKYNVANDIITTGFASNEQYRHYLLASDIGINLRTDSRGETSRALLMNMAYGLPTIINDYASFSEIPDETACKVKLNSSEDFILKLRSLIEEKNKREAIGKNAYNYIINGHNINNIANDYYNCSLNYKKDIEKPTNNIEEVSDIIVERNLDKVLTNDEYAKLAKIVKEFS